MIQWINSVAMLLIVLLLHCCVCKCSGLTSNYSQAVCDHLSDFSDGETIAMCNFDYYGYNLAPPAGRNRECRVLYNEDCYLIQWCSGSSETPCIINNGISACGYATSCPAIVGMNLTFVCMSGSTVYKDGVSMAMGNNTNTVNFSPVRLDDAGAYECRQSGEALIFNISVSGE